MKKKLDSCKKNYIEIMIDMKNIILYLILKWNIIKGNIVIMY